VNSKIFNVSNFRFFCGSVAIVKIKALKTEVYLVLIRKKLWNAKLASWDLKKRDKITKIKPSQK